MRWIELKALFFWGGAGTVGKKSKNGSAGRVAELERPLSERDRVTGELTLGNRGDVPAGRAFRVLSAGVGNCRYRVLCAVI